MDPLIASIINILLTGLFSILAKVVEHKLAMDRLKIEKLNPNDKNEGDENGKEKAKRKKGDRPEIRKIKERKEINEEKSLQRKLLAPLFLWRTVLLIATTTLILTLLYHTGILSTGVQDMGNEPCPGRQNFQAAKEQEIKVKNGYAAYFMGWKFDEKNGGFFIKFKGPYKGLHKFGDGMYCPPIPVDTSQEQSTKELLMKECQASKGGCSNSITCRQSIIGYHLYKGDCDE